MEPAFQPGDRLIAGAWWQQARVGDVIVARNPERTPPLLLKRVARVLPPDGGGPRFFLSGDNPDLSRDSRHFGPLPASAVEGRVLWVYHRSGAGRRADPPPPALTACASAVLVLFVGATLAVLLRRR
jgi:hypothetical protein